MPHLTLEYSSNLAPDLDLGAFFAALAAAVGDFEGFARGDLKGRGQRVEDFFPGDPKRCRAFAHLDVRLLTGRDISVRQRLVEVCLKLLAEHVGAQMPPQACQLSVEVREMDRSTYGKGRPQGQATG